MIYSLPIVNKKKKDVHLDLINKWIRENPSGSWYRLGTLPHFHQNSPIGLKWTLAGNTLNPSALSSLMCQVDYLSKQLEFHLLGNHLLANAKALIFAGLFFTGDEACKWL